MSDSSLRELERAASASPSDESIARRLAVARLRTSGDCREDRAAIACGHERCLTCAPKLLTEKNRAAALRLCRGRREKAIMRGEERLIFEKDLYPEEAKRCLKIARRLIDHEEKHGREVAWIHLESGGGMRLSFRFDARPDAAVAYRVDSGPSSAASVYAWFIPEKLCPACAGRAARERGYSCKTCGGTGRAK